METALVGNRTRDPWFPRRARLICRFKKSAYDSFASKIRRLVYAISQLSVGLYGWKIRIISEMPPTYGANLLTNIPQCRSKLTTTKKNTHYVSIMNGLRQNTNNRVNYVRRIDCGSVVARTLVAVGWLEFQKRPIRNARFDGVLIEGLQRPLA